LKHEKRTEVSGAMSDFGVVTLLSAARCAGRDVATRFPVLKTRAAALLIPWGCLPRGCSYCLTVQYSVQINCDSLEAVKRVR
jgi:hypothetical protein